MKTKKSRLAAQLKAVVIAVGLSLVPVNEVDSGVSYGGGVALDFNGNVSVGGHILSTDKANALFGKVGLNYIVNGQAKGDLSLRLGGGYLFEQGITAGIEGSYTAKSASPFSVGIGVGYGAVKKGGNGDELGDICAYRVSEGGFVNRGGLCEKRCEDTGGTWVNGSCECPEDKGLVVNGTCTD